MNAIHRAALAFILVSAPAAAALAAHDHPFRVYEGAYHLSSGETVLIGRTGVISELARPFFLDWETGRFGYLMAGKEDDVFSAAASAAAPAEAPAQTIIRFSRDADGAIEALVIREGDSPARRAVRVTLHTDRDVTFRNGPVTLAGTLRMPADSKSSAPVPGIVLVHGSGPGERTQLSVMNAFFAGQGMAVLTYDKRGCGASGGDWKAVDLDVLAGDALAGLACLRAQPAVDPDRVGFWGISQGGWITPLAGSLGEDAAFVINSSGPATSLRRQDSFMMANTLSAMGFTEEESAKVLTALNLLYDYACGKASGEDLDAAMKKVRADPKTAVLAFAPAREIKPETMYAKQKIGDPAWFFHLDPDRDALAPYRRLRCPVLVTYGRLDDTVPVDESAVLLGGAAAEAPRLDLTIEIIPDAGHGYLRMQPDNPRSPVVPSVVSREFFAAIAGWLRVRGFVD